MSIFGFRQAQPNVEDLRLPLKPDEGLRVIMPITDEQWLAFRDPQHVASALGYLGAKGKFTPGSEIAQGEYGDGSYFHTGLYKPTPEEVAEWGNGVDTLTAHCFPGVLPDSLAGCVEGGRGTPSHTLEVVTYNSYRS